MGENRPVTTATKTPKADAALARPSTRRAPRWPRRSPTGDIGEHLGIEAEADRVVTHFFAATSPGYVGWRWAVTLTRAPRQKVVTVNEVVLLPGDGALAAPEWVPWKDRVAKGDLGPGDLVPVADDDLRLVAGYLNGDEALDGVGGPRDARGRPRGRSRPRAGAVDRGPRGRRRALDRRRQRARHPDRPGCTGATAAPAASWSGSAVRWRRCSASAPTARRPATARPSRSTTAAARTPTSGSRRPQHQPVSLTPVLDTISAEVWVEPDVEPSSDAIRGTWRRCCRSQVEPGPAAPTRLADATTPDAAQAGLPSWRH